MFDICCIGHITVDRVITPSLVRYMPGGTAWYFSNAVAKLDMDYMLVTALAPTEMNYVETLSEMGVEVAVQQSAHTVKFENIYGNDPDNRVQNVLQKADGFTIDRLKDIQAKVFHLGPLLAGDISTDLLKNLAEKALISLDVQGYLRHVIHKRVYPTGWPGKYEALQYVHTLKADEAELQALTDNNNVREGIKLLADWGVKEIVITNGSKGSLIYSDGVFHTIPAYRPKAIIDATGCGDTYMAGYLYKRVKGFDIQQSGEFAAAMASIKMESSGPFAGTEEDVVKFLAAN